MLSELSNIVFVFSYLNYLTVAVIVLEDKDNDYFFRGAYHRKIVVSGDI